MNRYLQTLKMHVPEFELGYLNNHPAIKNKTYEEAQIILAKYATPLPDELTKTAYLEQAYSNRVVYLINGRYYLLKKQRNKGTAYLFEL